MRSKQTKDEFFKKFTSQGGTARWEKMTQEQRDALIQKMVEARKKKREAMIKATETITQ